MKALWISLLVPLALVVGAGPVGAKPAQTFEFTCEMDLNQVSEADLDRANAPGGDFRKQSFMATGEKKCTFSANNNSQIRCEALVDWPDARNLTIKNFDQPCQWFLNENQCDVNREVTADNSTFKIKRIGSDSAQLELDCKGKSP